MFLHKSIIDKGIVGSTSLKINCRPMERFSSSQTGTLNAGKPDKLAGVVNWSVISRRSELASFNGTDGVGQIGITRKSYVSKKLLNQSTGEKARRNT